jgi:hypothetical protein
MEGIYDNTGTMPDRQITGHIVRIHKEKISQGTSKPFMTTMGVTTLPVLPHQHGNRVPHSAARSEIIMTDEKSLVYLTPIM